jgi:hypothetical protein
MGDFALQFVELLSMCADNSSLYLTGRDHSKV